MTSPKKEGEQNVLFSDMQLEKLYVPLLFREGPGVGLPGVGLPGVGLWGWAVGLLFSICSLPLQAQTVFDQYFAQAQAFDKAFPREKVFLHFDNTCYYQGDTIWYKAYVVDAATLKPSRISKPLYVELVDQLGNVHERQIVKLTNGEGSGRISLVNTFFTGYYEVRAYTKWMLTFSDDPQYFSRTLPIYRKRLSPSEPRSIAEYRMDSSMKQRPTEKTKGLTARFFPEGGRLVKGLTSVVGIETFSQDAGWVDISGFLLDEKGNRTSLVTTIHDGMGSFLYTPGEKPSTVEFDYGGKTYRFTLPKADDNGCVMRVNSRSDEIDIRVDATANLDMNSLALFVFSQGTPVTYTPVNSRQIRIPTSGLPTGILRLSLINAQGESLADRFCFVAPEKQMMLQGTTDKRIYEPHAKATCRLRLTDANGQPVSNASVSVAIRDAADTDIIAGDDDIATNLLLTSDLKGYIHQPGFYFSEHSASRRKMLDNLLIIRGWQTHDIEQAVGKKTFAPRYLPEDRLTLYGQVKSWFGKIQRGIGVTILAQNDSVNIAGSTTTDSLGYFSVPIDDFSGRMEALIQTRKDGKQFNRNTSVSLFRTFEPPLRPLDYRETHPLTSLSTQRIEAAIDSLYGLGTEDQDSIRQIDEVVVTAKRKRYDLNKETQAFERDIVAYYNIRQIVDRMRDEGKTVVDDLGHLLYQLNPNKFDRDGTQYGTAPLRFSIGGKNIDRSFVNKGALEHIETALLYQDQFRRTSYGYNSENYRVEENEMTDFFTNSTSETDTINLGLQHENYVRCDLTVDPGFEAWRSYKATHGIRRTYIQGYEPQEQHPQGSSRLLYWNPSLRTDENGEINIETLTGDYPTCISISAQAIHEGQPIAVTIESLPPK